MNSFRIVECFQNAVKGFLRTKIHTETRKYKSPEEVQVLKILISTGDSYLRPKIHTEKKKIRIS